MAVLSHGQVLLRGLDGRTQCLHFDSDALSVADLKARLHTLHGIPPAYQRIVTGTRELQDDKVLVASDGLFPFCTLLLRLVGGKGGFGSLLRGAGQNVKKTSNFDACRDMSGRRLRHVNAEKKLKEWKEDMKEKSLEKAGADHLKRLAKEAQQQKTLQEVEKVQQECREAAERVSSAVEDGLQVIKRAEVGKRKGALITEELMVKRSCLWDPVDADDDNDEDEDDGQVADEAGPSTPPERNNVGNASRAIEEGTDNSANGETLSVTSADGAAGLEEKEEVEQASDRQKMAVDESAADIACQPMELPVPEVVGSPVGSNGRQRTDQPLDLSSYATAAELQELGMDKLKKELLSRGLKCGGSLPERAARLFLLKSTPLEKLDKKHFAKPPLAQRR